MTQGATVEERVVAALRRLPPDRRAEVLDFAEFLAERLPAPPGSQDGLRPHGLCAGAFTVPDDFDAPLPEDVIALFEPS